MVKQFVEVQTRKNPVLKVSSSYFIIFHKLNLQIFNLSLETPIKLIILIKIEYFKIFDKSKRL